MSATILHPTDFSEQSRCALDLAASLARSQHARLVLLHVVPDLKAVLRAEMAAGHRPSEHFEEDMAGYRHEMSVRLQTQEVPGGAVAVERVLREGPVAETILRVAEELPTPLIVMGSHGKRGVEKVLLGSVAESVLRRAACPVVTVRQPVG